LALCFGLRFFRFGLVLGFRLGFGFGFGLRLVLGFILPNLPLRLLPVLN
jgi:hypothetical protein